MNNVLIIDDDKELCALMKKCVEQENLTAVVAGGGIEGLHILEESKNACSLIILDIMMPDLDGFQVLQQIRQTSNVPLSGVIPCSIQLPAPKRIVWCFKE